MSLLQNKNETILWDNPLVSVELISEFIQRLPSKHKLNIWNRYANNDGYLATYNIIQALHSFLTLLIKIKNKQSKPPKRSQIESKLQPLCNIISTKVKDSTNGMTRHEFNHNLHEWILLSPPKPISTTAFMSLTPTAAHTTTNDENAPINTMSYPANTMLIQSHSLNVNAGIDAGIDDFTFSPIGFDNEVDEKIAFNLNAPSSTTLKQSSKSVDYINAKTKKKKKNTKTKKKRQRMKKSKTNKFMATIKVGQTVKLTKDRMAYVRFKGKVKFSIGVWYGVEIYDVITKTRHNGTVFGKKYFNCPRNKGLFVQREIILSVVKPENIKKMLKQLERKQLQKRNVTSPSTLGITQNAEEQEIRKSFKRFQRLSAIMQKVPAFKGVERKFSGLDEEESDGDEQNEFFEVIKSNDDEKRYELKMYKKFEKYIESFECVNDKGLLIKELNVSNYGRALLLEFGVQGNNKWFVESIDDKNVQKYTIEDVNNLLDSIVITNDGYSVVLKQR